MVAYDPQLAVDLSALVDRAYETFHGSSGPNPPPPETLPGEWTYQANIQVRLASLDTDYFIGWFVADGDHHAVVFLGTEDLEWLYDLDFTHTGHPIGGKVESGMYDMYRSLAVTQHGSSERTPFEQRLDSLDATGTIYVTGHSLGGALTTFTAADLATRPKPPDPSKLLVYSLASPRVGDATFAGAFNALVPNNFRIHNVPDLVPRLPPEDFGYAHVASPMPDPPLDSRDFPVYDGWNPIKAVGCFHSEYVYDYMLRVRAGQTPDEDELGDCKGHGGRGHTSVRYVPRSS